MHCTIKFADFYRKVDLANKMNGRMNGMQINYPTKVERSFLDLFHY